MIISLADNDISGSFTALDHVEIEFSAPVEWIDAYYPFDAEKTVNVGNNIWRLFFDDDFIGYSSTVQAGQVGQLSFDGPGNEHPTIVFGQICDKNGLTGEPVTTAEATTEEPPTPEATTEGRVYEVE